MSVFALDARGHLPNEGSFVFYNNPLSADGAIEHLSDDRTGAGKGDDEQIVVCLDRLGPKVHKVLFLVSIYEGQARRQEFSEVEEAYIRALDESGRELARYTLTDQKQCKNKCTLVFAEVCRQDGDWKFRALGEPYATDRFHDILVRQYARR